MPAARKLRDQGNRRENTTDTKAVQAQLGIGSIGGSSKAELDDDTPGNRDVDFDSALATILAPLLRVDVKQLWQNDSPGTSDDARVPSPLPLCKAWDALMSRTMPAGVRYSKALNRLLVSSKSTFSPPQHVTECKLMTSACLYHACEYKDVNIFCDAEVVRVLRKDLEAKEWSMLHIANRIARCGVNKELGLIPTPQEIHNNIEEHKRNTQRSNNETSSAAAACAKAQRQPEHSRAQVENAVKDTLKGIADDMHDSEGRRALLSRIANEDDASLAKKWMRVQTQTPECVALLKEHRPVDASVFGAVFSSTEADALAAYTMKPTARWDLVDTLTDFATLNQHIPTNVMSTIQDMASSIAGDLQRGHMRLEELDLRALGEKVLDTCNADDINTLACNVNNILPALANGNAGQSQMMTAMMQQMMHNT